MNILYLCTFYHRALLFRQQMDSLIKRGHNIRAFSSAKYGEGIAEKFRPIMDELVVHKECWNKYDRMLFFPRQWKIEKELQKAYNLKEFDLIHSHLLLSSGYTAIRMKKKYGVPYVVSVRVTDLTGYIRLPYFRGMAVRIIKEASGIIFLSACHKEEFTQKFVPAEYLDEFNSKCEVISNCIEPFWEENTANAPRVMKDKKKVRLLAVAKIRPIKNLTVAAQAVEVLKNRGYDARLTVVGEVQDKEEYERIKAYSCVDILPFKKKEELIDIYNDNDIFLLPSVNETFGRAYVEAMTQGLPVIYTQGQGFDKNFPDGEVGYSVPCDAPETIADRIEETIKRYDEISPECIEKSRLFYEDRIIDKLESFYEKALKRG